MSASRISSINQKWRKFSGFSARWAGFVILSLIAALVYEYFFLSRAYIEFEYSVERSSAVEVMWAGAGEEFTRTRMARGLLTKDSNHCGFFIGDLRKISSLRIDPTRKPSRTITFKKITLSQPGMPSLVFTSEIDFQHFRIGTDLTAVSFTPDQGWSMTSKGYNPFFRLDLDLPAKRSLDIPVEAGRFILLLGLLYLFFRPVSLLILDYNYVWLAAFGIVLLALVMARTSLYDHHPDEGVHVAAAAYYENHWLMPAVDSPEISSTFSIYGYSRLNSKEISYFLTGKFARLLDHFHLPDFQRYRLFNVALLTGMMMLTFQFRTARLIFIPFLLTPQAWYIFSYYNSDAFALFIAFLAAFQAVEQDSLFNRYLRGQAAAWQAVILLGPLAGALLMAKKNFYFFLLFLVLYLAAGCMFKRYQLSWAFCRKLFVLILVGMSLPLIRYGVDVSVNGFHKAERVQQIREQVARDNFKPSTPLEKKHHTLYLRSRGVSLTEFFEKHLWGAKVMNSFYGVYGYMTVSGTTYYYKMMLNIGFLLLGFMTLTILFRGGWWENTMLLNVIICSLALIGMAAYKSWTVDFQAQGRYLLVILPMLGMLTAHTEKLFQPLIFRSLILFMFVMSADNYIFVGIYNIAKYGWG